MAGPKHEVKSQISCVELAVQRLPVVFQAIETQLSFQHCLYVSLLTFPETAMHFVRCSCFIKESRSLAETHVTHAIALLSQYLVGHSEHIVKFRPVQYSCPVTDHK